MNAPLLERFVAFVENREALRKTKQTDDDILRNHHFCNVNREDDRVTQWIHTHVRTKYYNRGKNFMLLQIMACRIFNDPPVLSVILPLSPEIKLMKYALTQLKVFKAKEGNRIMRGAYMMPTHGAGPMATGPVEDYWFASLYECAKLDITGCTTLAQVAEALMTLHGVGEFVANQIVTDMRYVPIFGSHFTDWDTFILCGPGTRRGLNRFFGRPLNDKLKSEEYVQELLDVRFDLIDRGCFNGFIEDYFDDPNNLSNCFCEFDKYCRAVDQRNNGLEITLRHYHKHEAPSSF